MCVSVRLYFLCLCVCVSFCVAAPVSAPVCLVSALCLSVVHFHDLLEFAVVDDRSTLIESASES